MQQVAISEGFLLLLQVADGLQQNFLLRRSALLEGVVVVELELKIGVGMHIVAEGLGQPLQPF